MKTHRTFGIESINGRTICLNILKVSLTRAIINGIATVISARLFTGCSPNPPSLNVFAVVAIPRGIKVTIFFPTSRATPIGLSSFKYNFHPSPISPVKSVRCAVSSSRCALKDVLVQCAIEQRPPSFLDFRECLLTFTGIHLSMRRIFRVIKVYIPSLLDPVKMFKFLGQPRDKDVLYPIDRYFPVVHQTLKM